MRDALWLWREQRYNREPVDPANGTLSTAAVWVQRGYIQALNDLLREGPRLAVYYDRYVREQEASGQEPAHAPEPRNPPPGEPPDVES